MGTAPDNTQRREQNWLENRHPLDVFFKPRGVALIGAGERPGAIGRKLLWNLISSPFGGAIFPVHAVRRSVLGIKAYRSVGELPDPVDLAVIVRPAPETPAIVRECSDAGIAAAIIIAAGFRESGPKGLALERETMQAARQGNMRIIGPNCLGVMSPATGLNATPSAAMALSGSVGFISQSGALCEAVIDWSLRENVGFSAVISGGTMMDVSWSDLIYYLGEDQQTKSIVIYMESIGDARAFMSAAREIALAKPIVLMKAGRTTEAGRAAAVHLGAFSGDDEVLAAALRRCGVLRVNTISELFDMAEVLAKQPRPAGNRLTIVTNAGGPGVLATDALISGGGRLAPISPSAQATLDEALPNGWSRQNPIDLQAEAGAAQYEEALTALAGEDESDGTLVILAPQAISDPLETARQVVKHVNVRRKPLLASWMGGKSVTQGVLLLNEANIPTYDYPDDACRAFNSMWRYSRNLRALYETAGLATNGELEDWQEARDAVTEIIHGALDAGRALLTGEETRRLLAPYGISSGPDHSGVEPPNAVELMLASRIDALFGPVLIFGAGGRWADVIGDQALALPPLTTTLARRLMEETRIYRVLSAEGGTGPETLEALERLLVRFSFLVVEHPRIREIELNPLLATAGRLAALNARVLLHEASLAERELPRPAIRPYPTQYVDLWRARNGTELRIRPIYPADEPKVVRFHERLSERTVYLRYFQALNIGYRVSHQRLTRTAFIDYDREMVLVATYDDLDTGEREIAAIGRLSKSHGRSEAEFALLVADNFQRMGLGTELLTRLLQIARNEGVNRVFAFMLPDNHGMRQVCKKLGFTIQWERELVLAAIELPTVARPVDSTP